MTATIAPVTPIRPQASPDLRCPAAVLAASAHRSGVTAKGLRRLFARCDEIGLSLSPEAEEATLSWLAEITAASA